MSNKNLYKIDEKLKTIINDTKTIKAVATVDKNGIPHVVYKGSLHVDEKGNLVLYEILESSKSNQNLVYSIWFDKKIAINVLSVEKESYEIIARPLRSITAGREFEEIYKSIRTKLGDVDLGAIWLLEAESVGNKKLSERISEDEAKYPILKHLDRFVI